MAEEKKNLLIGAFRSAPAKETKEPPDGKAAVPPGEKANCAAKIHGLFRIGGEIMQDSLLARVGEAVLGWPMMALLLGTGIWYMLRLRGLPLCREGAGQKL